MISEYFITAKTNFLKIKKEFKQGGYQNPKPQESQKTKETKNKPNIYQIKIKNIKLQGLNS